MSSDDEEVFSEDSLEDSSGSDIFSEAESSDLEELFDSDSGDEDFQGFSFNMPDNIQWTRGWYEKDASVFQLQSGPTRNMQDSATAADYFDLFIDRQTIDDIVMFTNQNAVAKGARNWNPVSREEMKAFIAMLIISNHIVVVPRDERLFLSASRTKIFHVPGVRNILTSRDRFFELKKYIYFCDPEHVLTEEEKKDPLYKVRHFYNTVVQKFKAMFNCGRQISVDEAMIPFKGKLTIKVRMPDKPVKFGVKLFMLCDSKTGYCKNFTMYAGKNDREVGNVGKTGAVVMELVEDLFHSNHHLYMDNFYTSPILFKLLKERGILAAGTARPRKNYPSEELKREKLSKRGEVAWLSWFNSLALRWKDRKDVYFLSTIHAPPDVPVWVGLDSSEDSGSDGERAQSQEVVQRREKVNGRWVTKKIYRPEIVKDYNTYMGGVDLCDQMTSLNKAKKQKRWYLRVFLKIVMISIYNAYILEGHIIPHLPRGRRKRDLLSFQEELCIQLVGNFPQTHSSLSASKRRRSGEEIPGRLHEVGEHFPVKGEGTNHRCAVCEKKFKESKRRHDGILSKRRKTTFKCVFCNVYLCIGGPEENCFFDYHTKLQYWL